MVTSYLIKFNGRCVILKKSPETHPTCNELLISKPAKALKNNGHFSIRVHR